MAPEAGAGASGRTEGDGLRCAMTKLDVRLRPALARLAVLLCAATVIAVPSREAPAAPAGYVYYLQTFGDWTVTCGRDESLGRDNCTLSAPPPERHGETQIELGNGQGDNDAVIVRVRGALMPESPLYLRVDDRAPHQTQPNRFGEGRWNGEEAETIIAELNAGQRAVVRSFSGPPPTPRDAFFSLGRFQEALADLDGRTSAKPPAETAQATPAETQPRGEAPPPATVPPVAPPPVPQPQPEAAQIPPQPPQPPPQAKPVQPEPPQTAPLARQEPAPAPEAPSAEARGAITVLDEAHIGRARLTSNVVNREPVDELGPEVDLPSSGEDFVYFFTEIRGMGGRTVTHRWQYGGNVVASVPFQIGSDRWRVYSRKGIASGQTGAWTVTAVGPNGNELARAAFTAE